MNLLFYFLTEFIALRIDLFLQWHNTLIHAAVLINIVRHVCYLFILHKKSSSFL